MDGPVQAVLMRWRLFRFVASTVGNSDLRDGSFVLFCRLGHQAVFLVWDIMSASISKPLVRKSVRDVKAIFHDNIPGIASGRCGTALRSAPFGLSVDT